MAKTGAFLLVLFTALTVAAKEAGPPEGGEEPASPAEQAQSGEETLESEAVDPVSRTLQAIPGLLEVRQEPSPVKLTFRTPARWRSLKQNLDQLIGSLNLGRGEAGLFVVSMADGKPVYSYHGTLPLNPASNVKVITSAAALTMLGPDYRFKTEIYLDDEPVNGVVEGNLYVKGYGDPTMVSERLWMLTVALKRRGIEKVNGRIVIDDTFFAGDRHNPGWVREQDGSQAYQAPYGAVSLNFNAVRITVLPGNNGSGAAKILTEPDTPYIKVRGSVSTVGRRRTRLRIEASPEGDNTVVQVRGRINERSGGRSVYRKIEHPALFFGYALRDYMRKQGIKIPSYSVRVKKVPDSAELFYTFYSPPLSQIIWSLNKNSNNFTAEQILKTMGAELYEPPGDWVKGLKAVSHFLDYLGVPPESYRLVNGSGLSDMTRISPMAMVRVLHFMYLRTEAMPEYLASMSIAGADGTLRNRLGDQGVGRMRGKTGSLDRVAALSGYVIAPNREILAFSTMINNDLPYSRQTEILDEIAAVLAETKPVDERRQHLGAQ